ncbi:hypothetical protein [Blastopirellula marina]|uniref:Uncharacterized protein n=1 Tax=Blastopirellula marina TaxID=124 RepID=A0A2S8FTH9_9BACT|nr:hypothetical protein [Blastopirellula marina]PQO35360.1 hypothetical protein C5Y98_13405 [Blastopirellula marina]PTL44000.1 hypothetical protein C5Y97_13415 [Blastopirellula marina]
MATICSNCGEELIGAVNRCWRCGREFELDALADTPPVRRMRILPEYLHARTIEVPSSSADDVAVAEPADDEIIAAEAVEKKIEPLRLDSPFRPAELAPPQREIPWISIALGAAGLGSLLSLVTVVGLPLLLFSIGIIIWQIGSIPARRAWFFLMLSMFLFVVASVRFGFSLHDYLFG